MDLIEIEKWQRDTDLEDLEGFRHGTRAAPTLYRVGTVKAAEGDGPMVFIASDDTLDRHGDSITADGWDVEAFKTNPVFMWLHGRDENHLLPIGRVPKIWIEKKQLLAAVEWDGADAFAVEVRGKYQRGFLKAVSVGFRPLEFEEIEPDDDAKDTDSFFPGIKFLKQELLEISAVPVPANPRALQRAKGWNFTRSRSYHFPISTIISTATEAVITVTPGTTTIKPSWVKDIPAEPLAPIAKAIREFSEALRGPGGK